jgi:DNA-binding GntR family transcriptional regulator
MMIDRSALAPNMAGSLGGTSYARVRDVIRQDIINGAFIAGARLKAVELAERYGVSPVPVREALQQLQGEGLVHIEPNRGARVRRIDAKFVADVFEIRELLSALLATKAAGRMTPAIIAELERHEAAFEAAIATSDVALILRANHAFHHAHISAADNPEAQQLMDKHLALLQTLRMRAGFSTERAPQMVEEHRAMLDGFRTRNARAVARWARRHTRGSHEDMIKRMHLQPCST